MKHTMIVSDIYEALEYYKALVSYDPTNQRIYEILASLYSDCEQDEDTIGNCNALIEMEP